jgi:hypothetical protein
MLNMTSQDINLDKISTFHKSVDTEENYNDNVKAVVEPVLHKRSKSVVVEMETTH